MKKYRYKISVADEQTRVSLDHEKIHAAVSVVLKKQEIPSAEISVALVDDETIHAINQEFLEHDYPTDVISFPLNDPSEDSGCLEGEIVVSTDTAFRDAHHLAFHGWTVQEECYLYIIHGALHLAGYDDHAQEDLRLMRAAEIECLKEIGIQVPEGLHDRDGEID
ncbi:MAG: rRNA maturation RNase YbeY [Planctomycetia bacterium]|nr:rRNA maturation RNase YbeY [Planctomycetia bacterium]